VCAARARARAEIRATCHGISAAAGKVGAVVGGAALAPALKAYGLSVVMFACGVVALLGAACTVLLTKETMGVELERMAEMAVMGGGGGGSLLRNANGGSHVADMDSPLQQARSDAPSPTGAAAAAV
jgi:hypothetical protein